MRPVNRPLSPHLTIYRLPMLALLSITHRITGVALTAGTLILVYWLLALAAGPTLTLMPARSSGLYLARLSCLGSPGPCTTTFATAYGTWSGTLARAWTSNPQIRRGSSFWVHQCS